MMSVVDQSIQDGTKISLNDVEMKKNSNLHNNGPSLPRLDYLDEFLSLPNVSDLLAAGLFPSAKEITESMACWYALRRHVFPRLREFETAHKRELEMTGVSVPSGRDVILFVGDGVVPRTAYLVASLLGDASLDCVSIDPILYYDSPTSRLWSSSQEAVLDLEPKVARWREQRGLTCVRAKIQELQIRCRRAVFVLMHSHVSIESCLSAVEASDGVVAFVTAPCCNWEASQRKMYDLSPNMEYYDPKLLSEKNLMRVWYRMSLSQSVSHEIARNSMANAKIGTDSSSVSQVEVESNLPLEIVEGLTHTLPPSSPSWQILPLSRLHSILKSYTTRINYPPTPGAHAINALQRIVRVAAARSVWSAMVQDLQARLGLSAGPIDTRSDEIFLEFVQLFSEGASNSNSFQGVPNKDAGVDEEVSIGESNQEIEQIPAETPVVVENSEFSKENVDKELVRKMRRERKLASKGKKHVIAAAKGNLLDEPSGTSLDCEVSISNDLIQKRLDFARRYPTQFSIFRKIFHITPGFRGFPVDSGLTALGSLQPRTEVQDVRTPAWVHRCRAKFGSSVSPTKGPCSPLNMRCSDLLRVLRPLSRSYAAASQSKAIEIDSELSDNRPVSEIEKTEEIERADEMNNCSTSLVLDGETHEVRFGASVVSMGVISSVRKLKSVTFYSISEIPYLAGNWKDVNGVPCAESLEKYLSGELSAPGASRSKIQNEISLSPAVVLDEMLNDYTHHDATSGRDKHVGKRLFSCFLRDLDHLRGECSSNSEISSTHSRKRPLGADGMIDIAEENILKDSGTNMKIESVPLTKRAENSKQMGTPYFHGKRLQLDARSMALSMGMTPPDSTSALHANSSSDSDFAVQIAVTVRERYLSEPDNHFMLHRPGHPSLTEEECDRRGILVNPLPSQTTSEWMRDLRAGDIVLFRGVVSRGFRDAGAFVYVDSGVLLYDSGSRISGYIKRNLSF